MRPDRKRCLIHQTPLLIAAALHKVYLGGLCIRCMLLYNNNRSHTIQNTTRKCDMRPDGRRLEGRRAGGRAARWNAARRDAARRIRLGEITPYRGRLRQYSNSQCLLSRSRVASAPMWTVAEQTKARVWTRHDVTARYRLSRTTDPDLTSCPRAGVIPEQVAK